MSEELFPLASARAPVVLIIVVPLLAVIQSVSAYWRFLLEAISALVVALLRDDVARIAIDLLLAFFELIRVSVFVVIVFPDHHFERLTIAIGHLLLVQSHPYA